MLEETFSEPQEQLYAETLGHFYFGYAKMTQTSIPTEWVHLLSTGFLPMNARMKDNNRKLKYINWFG